MRLAGFGGGWGGGYSGDETLCCRMGEEQGRGKMGEGAGGIPRVMDERRKMRWKGKEKKRE